MFFFFLFQVNEECKNLKQSLAQQEKECLLAKEQVTALEAKITSLEQVIKVRLCFICFSFLFISTSAKISFVCVCAFLPVSACVSQYTCLLSRFCLCMCVRSSSDLYFCLCTCPPLQGSTFMCIYMHPSLWASACLFYMPAPFQLYTFMRAYVPPPLQASACLCLCLCYYSCVCTSPLPLGFCLFYMLAPFQLYTFMCVSALPPTLL